MQRAVLLLIVTIVFIAGALFLEQTYVAQGAHECAGGEALTLVNCWKEVLSRSILHLLGSFGIIALLFFSKKFLRFRAIAAIALIIVLFFGFQEFYLHPLRYDQPLFKSIIDFLVWTVPLALYIFVSRPKAKQT